MYRSLILVAGLAALPAPAFDLEKWVDGLANRQMDKWKKEQIETAIKGRDADERLKAVEGLSYADEDSLAAIAVALGDSDARVRRAAASQMWSAEKRAEPYRPQLTKALDDPDANVVAYAAGALQAQGVKEADLVAPRKRVLDSAEASVTSRYLVSRNLVGNEPPAKLLAAMLAYLEQNSRDNPSRGNTENVGLAALLSYVSVRSTCWYWAGVAFPVRSNVPVSGLNRFHGTAWLRRWNSRTPRSLFQTQR